MPISPNAEKIHIRLSYAAGVGQMALELIRDKILARDYQGSARIAQTALERIEAAICWDEPATPKGGE